MDRQTIYQDDPNAAISIVDNKNIVKWLAKIYIIFYIDKILTRGYDEANNKGVILNENLNCVLVIFLKRLRPSCR
jgi:hypothetical protein